MKPSFFHNVDLLELSPLHRLLFEGLWCYADREGRLIDKAKQIKHDILPMDDCDIDAMLEDLKDKGFIIRYEIDSQRIIEVVNFEKHQNPHPKELPSVLAENVLPRKEISSRVITLPAVESSVPEMLSPFPSVTCHLSPHHADPGEAEDAPAPQEETPETHELDLEDDIEVFAPNAYRRNGRPRIKLGRRSDQQTVDRLHQGEDKLGKTWYRWGLLGFLESDKAWLRENGWPLAEFIKNPEGYPRQKAPPAAPSEPQQADAPTDIESRHLNGTGTLKPAVQRNWLEEWNQLVPEQPTQYNSIKHLNLTVQVAGPDFRENFDKVISAAKKVIAAKGDGASWLDLYWLCKYADGADKPNWWHLLFGIHRYMTKASGVNSDIGTGPRPWVPGIVCENPEQRKERRAWQKMREAKGKHTDSDKAAREGDIT